MQANDGRRTSAQRSRSGVANMFDKLSSTAEAAVNNGSADASERILAFANFLKNAPASLDATSLINGLIDISGYYQFIGEGQEGLKYNFLSLEHLKKTGEKKLERRVHNAFAHSYIRLCDIERATRHLSYAHDLSLKAGDHVGRIITLSNVPPLLYGMGSVEAAMNVARMNLSLLGNNFDRSDQKEKIEHARLQNSTNGLKIALEGNHLELAQEFYAAGNAQEVRLLGMTNLNLSMAYFDSSGISYLARVGRLGEARARLVRMQRVWGGTSNFRFLTLLTSAEAAFYQATGDKKTLRRARLVLSNLLPVTRHYPAHYEDILKALVILYGAENTEFRRRPAYHYLQLLRAHIIGVRHQALFLVSHLKQNGLIVNGFSLENPRHAFSVGSMYGDVEMEKCDELMPNDELAQISGRISALTPVLNERSMRTERYEVAENWAVAAEFVNAQDGRHCFFVGGIAGLIAQRQGLDAEKATAVELACRLHDVGQVAVDSGTLRDYRTGRADQYRYVWEHTTAGHSLLSENRDETLQLAGQVARHHHEWWNGQGGPDGLRGEAIPLAARICAVADYFVGLVRPVRSHGAWTVEEALKQVSTMGGVQLDPNIVKTFVKAVREENSFERVLRDSVEKVKNNGLLRARNALDESISSAT